MAWPVVSALEATERAEGHHKLGVGSAARVNLIAKLRSRHTAVHAGWSERLGLMLLSAAMQDK